MSDPQFLCPSPPRNCFRSRVPLSVNGADGGHGGGRGNWGRNLLLPRARFSLSSFVREPPPQGHGAKEEGASALSRLEWNRPRAKFLMERVCLSSPRLPPSVACDAVVGMRKRPTECELSLHHDSRHSRAHIQMHQSEWLKVEILLRNSTRISYIRTGVITLSSLTHTTPILGPSKGPSCSSSAHLPSCHSFHTDDDRHVHR